MLIVALALAGVGAVLMLIAQAGNSGGSIGDWLGTRVGRVWLGRVATLIAIGVLLDDIAATARGSRFGTIVSIWLPLPIVVPHDADQSQRGDQHSRRSFPLPPTSFT